MADILIELTDWSRGINSANEPDEIPNNATPKAWNSAFRGVGNGLAEIGVRPGYVTVNDTAFTSTPEVFRQVPYAYNNAGTHTHYIATWANNGTLRYKEEDDDYTSALVPPANFPYAASSCFTSGEYPVDATVMDNRVFAVNTNAERRSLLDQTYKTFGLEPIATIAVSNQATGSSSMPAEAYGVCVTSYDSATGAESSRSAISSVTLGANERVRVIITPTSTESALYSHWRVYLRRDTTQSQPYQVTSFEDVGGSAISTTSGNIPIATTTVYIDLSAAAIANNILASPNDTENDPPPTTTRYLTTYGRRLIAADTTGIYWSKLDKPDNFPPENYEPIETGEGDEVRGVRQFSSELLMVFTTSSVWGVFGNDPQTWVIRPINQVIGCAGHLSIVTFPDGIGWWSAEVGPVIFDGSRVLQVGLEKLGHAAIVDDIEPTLTAKICAGYDPEGRRILWSAAEDGESRNTITLPFNIQMGQWESSKWDGIDTCSYAVGPDENDQHHLFAGGYEGQVFKLDEHVKNDGVVSGTKTGTFVATGVSQGTITSTGFYNSNGKLTDRKVTVVDANNKPIARRRITSNDSTTLTLNSNVTGLITGATYTFYIGGPDFRFYTKWLDGGLPFIRKRFDRVYVQVQTVDAVTGVFLSTHVAFADSDGSADNVISTSSDVWDTGYWDSAFWSGTGRNKRRIAVFKNSDVMRIAVLHFTPDVDITVHKLSVLARTLSDRIYD